MKRRDVDWYVVFWYTVAIIFSVIVFYFIAKAVDAMLQPGGLT